MAYQIEPKSFGGILDQGFQLMRNHFVLLTAPMIAVYVPYSLAMDMAGIDPFSGAAGAGEGSPMMGLSGLIPMAVGLLFFISAFPYAQLVVTRAVADAYLEKPLSIGETMAELRGVFWPYVGTFLLFTLGLMAGFMCFVIPGIYLSTAWSLVGAIAVMERVFGPDALGRSRALVKGHWWRVLGVNFVSYLIVWVFSMAAQMSTGFIPIVGPAISGLVSGVGYAYLVTVLIVVYVDLRCRKESFDLELMRKQIAEDVPAGPAAPFPGATP